MFLNDEQIHSSKMDGDEAWSFVVGKDETVLVKNNDSPWGPGSPITAKVAGADAAEEVETPALKLPQAGVVWGTATLYEKPLERGKSEELGRSHGFFVRVRGRLINLDDEDFSLGPELRHGTLTRFRMEVNADDLDAHVASARETIKESTALTELRNYLLAIFNKARSVSLEQDRGDVPSSLGKNGRLADPPTALSQGPLRRMLQRAVAGDESVLQAMGIEQSQLSLAEEIISKGADVVESVLLERREESSPFIIYDPAKRAAVLNQGHPFVSNYIGGKVVAEAMKLMGLAELLAQAYMLDENVPGEVVGRVVRRRDNFLRALAQRYPRSAHVIASQLRDATNDENALEDAVCDALELLGFTVRKLGGPGHGADGIATARLGLRSGSESESYAFTYDAKSTADALKELLNGEDGTSPAPKRPGKIRADTARTSVLKVHRQRAAAEYDLDVEPAFTLLVAPDFQGADAEMGLINDVCRNDEITAVRVGDLARLVELFVLQGLNPLDLRTLFDLRTPDETRKWVDEQSDRAKVTRPPVALLVECLVKNSERRRPTTFDALGAYLQSQGLDLSIPEIEALVRGLAALAPKSVYHDDRVVALNSSPDALYAEMRSSLDEFDPDLVHDYLSTVPRPEPSGGPTKKATKGSPGKKTAAKKTATSGDTA